jgi:hypothetical protein
MAGPSYPSYAVPTSGVTAGGGGAAMAAGAMIPGLGQLIMPLLAAFGPALFSKLFNKGQDPNNQIRQLLKPETLAKLQAQFYQQGLQSPAFSQAQGSIATGANQASNQVAASLAARGLGTTGTGAVLSGLTPSLVGSQKSQLYTQVGNQATQQARQSIQDQIAALQNQQPSQSQSLLGNGLEAFGPYLQSFMQARYPNAFNNMTTPGGR